MKILTKILKQSRTLLQGIMVSCLMWANQSPAISYFGTSSSTLQAAPKKAETHPSKLKYISSTQNKQINQHLYQQLKNIFKNVVSLDQTLSKTQYSLICDRAGHILLATVNHNNRHFQAIRYTNSQGYTGYYTPNGKALFKTFFLKAPVQYTRISDQFTTRRWHPILHLFRPHFGIDYAAPTGTPIRAVGSGHVNFAGKDGGYGNVVVIQHDNRYQSLYAHLSRFASFIKQGQWVNQGQIIGYVGSTGLATGPHLHFGFYDNGRAINPAKILNKAQAPAYIAQEDRSDFIAKTNHLFTQLAYNQAHSSTART